MAKVVLITGANKGIGFEVARQLGHAGFTVLLGARDASRGEEAAVSCEKRASMCASLQRTSTTQAEVRQSLPSKSAQSSDIWMYW